MSFLQVIDLKGPLPASLLSDMWGRFWNNLYKHMVPYPNKPNLDPSEAMKEQVPDKNVYPVYYFYFFDPYAFTSNCCTSHIIRS